MPIGVTEWIRSSYQRPIVQVRVNNVYDVRDLISVSTEGGYDQMSMTCNFTVAQTTTPRWRVGDEIRVYMGYGGPGGFIHLVFIGEIETIGERYVPRMLETTATSYSRRLQRPYGNINIDPEGENKVAYSYSNKTDSEMWNDLCRRAGVPQYACGDGDGITYATHGDHPYEVALGTKLGDIIGKLDAASPSGQRSFDIAGWFIRRPVLVGVPSLNVVWRYAEGAQGLADPYLPIVEISHDASTKSVKNQAYITGTGTPADADTEQETVAIFATRQAPNDLVGNDGDGNPIYEVFSLSSDLIETRDQCVAVATRYMVENNKPTDELTMKVALNPHIVPGQSIGVTSAKMGLSTQRPYFVKHVGHEVGDGGGWTNMRLEGGAGSEGYLVGLPPIAIFTMEMSVEGFEIDGVSDTWYTITCDGSSSFDMDGTIVGYAWEASNGQTGSGPIFKVAFNQAQWDDEETFPWIKLTVTDSDSDATGPHTDTTGEVPASSAETEDSQVEGLFVAANDQAEASPDGGASWFTWAPDGGAKVISVTRLAHGGTAYFGLDDGRIFKSEDFLQSDPVLMYTEPSGQDVTAIWVSEVNSAKVAVGCANGQVYLTDDDFATMAIPVRNFSHRINWIIGAIEGARADKQWRVATGSYVWITFDDFVTVTTLSTQSNTVEQIELSAFGNYNAQDTDGNVKVESGLGGVGGGQSITFPALSPAPTHARIGAFIRTDELMALDDQGRAFVKAPGASVFTPITSVGGGANLDLIPSRINAAVFYAGSEDGLYKTYDAGATWVRVRSYAGAGLRAIHVGITSEPVTPKEIGEIIERYSAVRWPHSFGVGGPSQTQGPGLPEDQDPIPELVEKSWSETLDNLDIRGTSVDISTPGVTAMTEYPTFYTLAFDDSASPWAYAIATVYTMAGLFGRADGVKPAGGNDGRNLHQLLRHKFSLPPTLVAKSAKLSMSFGAGQIGQVWFNEHEITSLLVADMHSYQGSHLILPRGVVVITYQCDIPLEYITPETDNLLAFYFTTPQVTSPDDIGKSFWRMWFNAASELSSETEGAYTYYVTSGTGKGLDLTKWGVIINDTQRDVPNVSIDPEPVGWEQQGYDDSGWNPLVGPPRWDNGVFIDNDDGRLALGHHSEWISANRFLQPQYEHKHLYRMHWSIPAVEFSEALLSFRYIHAVKIFFNGALIWQGGNASGHITDGVIDYQDGDFGEQLDIDVLANLLPGEDNVLAVEIHRNTPDPGERWNGTNTLPGGGKAFLGVCAVLRLL